VQRMVLSALGGVARGGVRGGGSLVWPRSGWPRSGCCPLRGRPSLVRGVGTGAFYKRELPSHLVPLSSRRGKGMFEEALRRGNLEAYFPLSEQFITQNEPAFCGLGSLAMVLNALKVDPRRPWKGPWRWYTEETLECCWKPLENIRQEGITLDEFQEIAACHGAVADLYRPPSSSSSSSLATNTGDASTPIGSSSFVDLGQFRRDVIRAVSGPWDPAVSTPCGYMVVSFWRPALGQTGTGHFSPLAAYHSPSDRALVLDVARFKFSPYWVSLPELFDAMQNVDDATGRSRGYSLIRPQPRARVNDEESGPSHLCLRNREHQFCDFQCSSEDCLSTRTGRQRTMNSAGELRDA